MPDLTLNEYRDIPEDALKPLIMAEERKMSGAGCRNHATLEKTFLFHFSNMLRKIIEKVLRLLTFH